MLTRTQRSATIDPLQKGRHQKPFILESLCHGNCGGYAFPYMDGLLWIHSATPLQAMPASKNRNPRGSRNAIYLPCHGYSKYVARLSQKSSRSLFAAFLRGITSLESTPGGQCCGFLPACRQVFTGTRKHCCTSWWTILTRCCYWWQAGLPSLATTFGTIAAQVETYKWMVGMEFHPRVKALSDSKPGRRTYTFD